MRKLHPIFTIGHSTHEIGYFLDLLCKHRITQLADVRSQPFSRIPHFNRDVLAAALNATGINYLQLGREVGARRDEPECYVDGQAVYERIAMLPLFQQGVQRILSSASDHVVALMCSEKEPLDCHRAILVCRHLRPYTSQIHHILADGRVESHQELERRLLKAFGIAERQHNLFVSDEQLLDDTYVARGKEIAYRFELQGARNE